MGSLAGAGFASMDTGIEPMDVFTAFFDGHPGAEFRSTMGIHGDEL
ncbi:hypothetical protein GO003_010790 [Methylicorpusculum oleiharenae]|nr:hypothetical protein [Methylicorpusculum oleiharenae]MCD2450878.1 hypothetical protein [Methylicorpusculum oleiharenae]